MITAAQNIIISGMDKPGCILDIGAHHGLFSRNLMQSGRFTKAYLFEANPDNAKVIRQTISGFDYELIECAISNRISEYIEFYCPADGATSSILKPRHVIDIQTANLRVVNKNLDQWYRDRQPGPVSFLKVDAQGGDLCVLRSAQEILSKQRPWVQAELVFRNAYFDQDDPILLQSFMAKQGYRIYTLADMAFDHSMVLQWCDILFVPEECESINQDVNIEAISIESLMRENTNLKTTCAERLNLIQYLHSEAEKRMLIINELQRSVTK